MSTERTLPAKQQAIAPIGAFMATGNMPGLNAALNQALDAHLTVSEIKEILVQLYAYAGFPRSLNTLGEWMKVLDTRNKRGIEDAPRPRAKPSGADGRCAVRRRRGEPDQAVGRSSHQRLQRLK